MNEIKIKTFERLRLKKLANLKNEMKFVVRLNEWDYKFVQAIWMNENYIKNLNNWDKKCSFVKNEI